MADALDVVDYYKHRAFIAEKKLKKIAEIVKQSSNLCFYEDYKCGEDCDMRGGCEYWEILQIIGREECLTQTKQK